MVRAGHFKVLDETGCYISIPASDSSYCKNFSLLISLGKKRFGAPEVVLIKSRGCPAHWLGPRLPLAHRAGYCMVPMFKDLIICSGAESGFVKPSTHLAPPDPRSDAASNCGLDSKEQMMLTPRSIKRGPQSHWLSFCPALPSFTSLLQPASSSIAHYCLSWCLVSSHEPQIQLSERSP